MGLLSIEPVAFNAETVVSVTIQRDVSPEAMALIVSPGSSKTVEMKLGFV